MSEMTAPLDASALAVLDDMLGRFCPAEGPNFLRCARARDHDGNHYDVVQRLEWRAADESEAPPDPAVLREIARQGGGR